MENKYHAIETFYNGYRFRSRLEARWAVFFDEAHIKYEYEPEGFYNKDGNCYLPDFYLPEDDTYVEVKGDTEEGRTEVQTKCESAIEWGGPIKQIIILSTVPDGKSPDGGIWHFPALRWAGTRVEWCWWFFYDSLDDYGNSTVVGNISGAHYPSPWYTCFRDPKSEHSIRAVSDEVLRNYFYKKAESPEDVREMIANQEEFNALTFKAFQKARASQFEFGVKE